MQCPNCQKNIPDDAKYCRFCGTKMEVAEPMFCQECGSLLDPGAKFCRKCGARADYNVAAAADSQEDTPLVIPVEGPVLSVSVSDKPPIALPPKRGATSVSSGAKNAKNVAAKVLNHLETRASSTPGEISYHISGGIKPEAGGAIIAALKALAKEVSHNG